MALLAGILKGNAIIEWGKLKLKFSKGDSKNATHKGRNSKTLTCSECILVISSWLQDGRMMVVCVYDRIIRDQLNYAEQKSINIQQVIFAYFMQEQHKSQNSEYSQLHSKSFESQMLHGILRGYLEVIMDELRRAIKENGFHKLEFEDMDHYVRSLSESLNTKTEQYIMVEYPDNHMVIKHSEFFASNIREIREYMKIMVTDIILTAKKIRSDGDMEIASIDKSTRDRVDRFVGFRTT